MKKEVIAWITAGTLVAGGIIGVKYANYIDNKRFLERVQTLTRYAPQTFQYCEGTPEMKNRAAPQGLDNVAIMTHSEDTGLAFEFNRGIRKRDTLYQGTILGLTTVASDVGRQLVGLDAKTPEFRGKLRFEGDSYSFVIKDVGADGIDASDVLEEIKYSPEKPKIKPRGHTDTWTKKVAGFTKGVIKEMRSDKSNLETRMDEPKIVRHIEVGMPIGNLSPNQQNRIKRAYRSLVDQAYASLVGEQK